MHDASVLTTRRGAGKLGRRQSLREEFENGKEYYAVHGQQVWMPADPTLRPSSAALEWHRMHKFLGYLTHS